MSDLNPYRVNVMTALTRQHGRLHPLRRNSLPRAAHPAGGHHGYRLL